MAKVRRRVLEDGRVLVVREDGSAYILDPQTGNQQTVTGPNPAMAEAFGTSDTSALDEQLAAIEAFRSSPAGQRAERLRQEAYDEDVRRFDAEQDIREGNLGVARQNADTSRFSAQTSRMDTEARIAELERRFNLDVGKFGADYVKTAIDYAKTPRRWIDSIMWESAQPIYQSIAAGRQLPAFGAKSSGPMPAMNNMTDTMSSLGFTNANQMIDPTKAVQQVLKAVPPGQSPAGQLSPQEVAVINLAQELYKAGGANVPEGQWESMDRDVQDSLLGAMDLMAPNGGDRYLRQLARTRLPTRSNPLAA